MNRRVVVTGMGCVTPVGSGWKNYWGNLLAGKNGISLITGFDTTDFNSKIAGEIKDFDMGLYIDKTEYRRMDRYTQFAVAAAKQAIDDAGIDIETVDKDSFGVYLGSGIGGMATLEEQHRILMERGPKRISPNFIPMMISNIATGHLSILFNAMGPSMTTVTACASSTNAIGEALKCIQRGDADMMIAGGSEASITPLAIAGFTSMKALSTRNDAPEKSSRPFDKERDGFVMAEGGGMLILEELGHALKRGAKIYAEMVGYGMAADSYHVTAPHPEGKGAQRSMERAIADSGMKPEDVDYINAHGTSTYFNDMLETKAIKSVFGEHAYKLAVSSTKSMTGHLLGGTGAVEAIATICAIVHDEMPPTMNYEVPDPECDLDYVPNAPRKKVVNFALSNSLGFGGHNSTIAFKKYKE
ncbi:MAG TPA: beta-ketoacyl-ACP synthase II [bacterium]|nr:beta-ketoacyl-ACP synthase II [bacterium]HRQ70937.1 beta-ketoacyl-ACP synthase II [bacterium]